MQLVRAFPEHPDHVQTVQLSGVSFRLTLSWRERTEAWYATLTLLDGTPVITGVRLEPSADLLRYADPLLYAPTLRPGQQRPRLLCLDAAGCGQSATRSTVHVVWSPGAIPHRSGSIVAESADGDRWVTTTTHYGGAHTVVTAVSEEFGPVEAEPSEIDTKVDPAYPGISAVINIERAVPGQDRVSILQPDLGTRAVLLWLPSEEIADPEAATWQASTVYLQGALVTPIGSGDFSHRATRAGTSSALEPAWPVVVGDQVEDGELVWECVSLSSAPDSVTVTP
jgi:hypothetical protein